MHRCDLRLSVAIWVGKPLVATTLFLLWVQLVLVPRALGVGLIEGVWQEGETAIELIKNNYFLSVQFRIHLSSIQLYILRI